MQTITLKAIADVTIKKGTVIPNLFSNDMPIPYEILIPKGSVLEKAEEAAHYYIITKQADGMMHAIPYYSIIFDYILKIAIQQGAKPVTTENDKHVYKMFSLITENRVEPEEGNYIMSFYAETQERAEVMAKNWIEKSNLPENFKYIVRL